MADADKDISKQIIDAQLMIAQIITQASAIETIIDSYIADFYTKSGSDYKNNYLCLQYDILNNRGVSLNTKIDVLFKIFERINKDDIPSHKMFINWVDKRNIIAHGKMIDADLFYHGKKYNISNLRNEFFKLQTGVNAALELYHSALGSNYFGLLPINPNEVEND